MRSSSYWGIVPLLLALTLMAAGMSVAGCTSAAQEGSAFTAAQQPTPGSPFRGPMGPGMMQRGGPAGQQPGATPGPYDQWPPEGMMGPGGMMGQGGMMGGMGSMMGGPFAPSVSPLPLNEAVSIAERQLQSLGNPDLAFDEVEGFAYNFYVPVYERSTRNFAFEMLIDRYSGAVMPEMGPNMMWNAKYGHMGGGMMGWGGRGPWATPVATPGPTGQPGAQGAPTVDTPVTEEQAIRNAQQFLDGFLPGSQTGDIHTFYGYRTIEVTRDGQLQGMISVNGYTGDVWYHSWHGPFIEEWQRTP